MKLPGRSFRNAGGQSIGDKCSAQPELKERQQSEFKQLEKGKFTSMSSLHRCLSTAKPSQLAINHKPQICRRLSLKNYFFKAFACCSLQVYLKYLKNWIIVSCSCVCHHTGRNLFFSCLAGFVCFPLCAFANEWVLPVNFWPVLAYHVEETLWLHLQKKNPDFRPVRVDVHQDEPGMPPVVLFCSFFTSGFI